jgi:hypothetical protein
LGEDLPDRQDADHIPITSSNHNYRLKTPTRSNLRIGRSHADTSMGLSAANSGESASSAKEGVSVPLHPLSWDKSWWTPSAWLLWVLSNVLPTCLIFVLNGMTQVRDGTCPRRLAHNHKIISRV